MAVKNDAQHLCIVRLLIVYHKCVQYHMEIPQFIYTRFMCMSKKALHSMEETVHCSLQLPFVMRLNATTLTEYTFFFSHRRTHFEI